MNSSCLICANKIKPFYSFGSMPIANGFISKHEFDNEFFYDMEVAFCDHCKMFQLIDQPKPQQMFNDSYKFFSGTSSYMETHFRLFANHVFKNYLNMEKDSFVIEIGSNDGIMLKHFYEKRIRHLGIEPSSNVAKLSMDKGLNTIIEFFDKSLAEKIVSEYGYANVFIAANVMCHIPNINSIVEGIKILLEPNGVVIFEDPYLYDIIQKTSFDQIYDEHTFLFSVHSIQYLFNKYDMELIDLEWQPTHGGSMRYIIAHKGSKDIQQSVNKQLKLEVELGLTNLKTFKNFKDNCESFRLNLMNLLNQIRSEGNTIAAYAATSKSTTLMNYCSITSKHLDCIYDTTQIKQGKFSPGVHIPIIDHKEFQLNYPDYALLLAYNHENEIMEKEKEFISQGGKWITYIPELKVVG